MQKKIGKVKSKIAGGMVIVLTTVMSVTTLPPFSFASYAETAAEETESTGNENEEVFSDDENEVILEETVSENCVSDNSISDNSVSENETVPVKDDQEKTDPYEGFGLYFPTQEEIMNSRFGGPYDSEPAGGESILSDHVMATTSANIKNYAISIDSELDSSRIPDNSYYAATPKVVTFIDHKNCINVAYPSGSSTIVQKYNPSNMKLIEKVTLKSGYGLFGSITCDDSGNYYVARGKSGSSTDKTMSVAKYNYSGNLLAELTLMGKETNPYSGDDWGTKEPFHAGNCAIAVKNGIVAVNYGRLMFNGHQSNMMIYANSSDLSRVYANTAYTSHSFDQRLYPFKNGGFIALNQGDAYDRGFHITKISEFQNESGFWLSSDDDFYTFNFREGAARSYGYNETFAQLGGWAELENGYVFAGSSERKLSLAEAPSSGYLGHNAARDLFIQIFKDNFYNISDIKDKYAVAGVTRTPEDKRPSNPQTNLFLTGGEVNYGIIWLTSYDSSSYAANPKVVSIGDNRFGVLWEKRSYDSYNNENAVPYITVMNSDGSVESGVRSVPSCHLAADTDPAVLNGMIYWATKDENGAYIHCLNPGNIRISKQPYVSQKTQNSDGSFNLELSIDVTGAESFTWTMSKDGVTWSPVTSAEAEGFDTAKLKIKKYSQDTPFYRCTLRDSIGYEVISDTAYDILKNAEDVYCKLGSKVRFSVRTIGVSKYQWFCSSNGSKWEEIKPDVSNGANTSDLTLTADENTFKLKYRCELKDLSGSVKRSAAVKARTTLEIITQPKDVVEIKGTTVPVSIEAKGDGLTYQWYVADSPAGPWKASTYKGNKTATLNIIIDEKSIDKVFKCTVKDKYGNLADSNVINVHEKSTIVFEKHTMTLVSREGSKGTVAVRFIGVDYNMSSLIWSSSDTTVATVDGNGVVTAKTGITESKTVNISAKTKDGLYDDTCVVTVNPIPTVQSPVSNIAQGTVSGGTRILLKTDTVGAAIYYTTDKSKPSKNSTLYTDAITIDKDTVIRAIAVKEGYKDSPESTFNYYIANNWGDIESQKAKDYWKKASAVPEDIWYLFDDATVVYKDAPNSVHTAVYSDKSITFSDRIKVFYGTDRLWENRDYTVTYANNKAAADVSYGKKAPKVIIKGKGNYTKTAEFTFTIKPQDLNNASLVSENDLAVKAATALGSIKPVLTMEGKKLSLNKDYYLTYTLRPNGELLSAKTKTQAGSEYEITISAKGNYTGVFEKKILVRAIDPKAEGIVSMSSVKVIVPKLIWNGSPYKLTDLFDNASGKDALCKVMNGKTQLIYGTDFTVDDMSLTDTGKYSVSVHGLNGSGTVYAGDKTFNVEITGIPASKVKVAGLSTAPEYTGNALGINDIFNPNDPYIKAGGYKQITLYDANGNILKPSTDYDIEMINGGYMGKIEVIFSLKGRYSGKIKKNINIKPANISKATVTVSDAVFTKEGARPNVIVKYGTKTLQEGKDYSLIFKNNAKVAAFSQKGAPSVTVRGTGNYTGNTSRVFTISKADMAAAVKLVVPDKLYSDKKGAFRSAPKLMDGNKALVSGTDYEKIDEKKAYSYYIAETGAPVEDDDIIPAGTVIKVTVTVKVSDKTPKSPYNAGTTTLTGYYKILEKGKDIKSATVKIRDAGKLTYDNAKQIIPLKESDLTVTLNKTVLKPSDYEIVSVKNNRFPGTATVEIRGTGEYGGTKIFTFKIGVRAIR